jgi:hypothetical protein
MLVYGAFLVIVGVTATAQALIVSQDAWTTVANETVGADTAMVRSFAALDLRVTDLTGPIDAARQQELNTALAVLTEQSGVLRVAIIAPSGTILTSSTQGAAGQKAFDPDGSLQATFSSQSADAGMPLRGADGSIGPPLTSGHILREYLPLVAEGKVWAVVGLWRDADPIFAKLDATRTSIVAITLTAATVIALVLFVMFRAAQGRITRQTAELVDATRRDPLTGSRRRQLPTHERDLRPRGGRPGVVRIDAGPLDGRRSRLGLRAVRTRRVSGRGERRVHDRPRTRDGAAPCAARRQGDDVQGFRAAAGHDELRDQLLPGQWHLRQRDPVRGRGRTW